jgi:hypothetical protein
MTSASAFMTGGGAHPAAHRSPAKAAPATPSADGVHPVVVDGHCELVDAHGVPLTDPLYWQRTGHDPC